MAKKKITYEDAVARIEEIAEILEKNQVSLEKSVELYKEGIELTLFCKKQLDSAQKEVMTLKKQFDGSFVECKFDRDEEVLE